MSINSISFKWLSLVLLGLYFFGVPLFIFGSQRFPPEYYKVIFSLVFLFIWMAIHWIARIFQTKKVLSFSKIDGALFFLIFILIITTGLNNVFDVALVGSYMRWNSLTHFIVVLLYVFTIRQFWDAQYSKFLKLIVGLSGLVLAIWVLAAWFVQQPFMFPSSFWNNAVGLGFGNPNFLAGYILVSLPFIAHLVTSLSLPKFVEALLVFASGLAIFATQSKSALVAACIWLLCVIFSRYVTKLSQNRYLFFAGSVFFLSLIFIWNVHAITGKMEINADNRSRIFRKLTTAVASKPLLGYGWAQTEFAFEQGTYRHELKRDVDIRVDVAHSTWLEVLVSSGFLGAGLFISIQLFALYWLYKSDNITFFASAVLGVWFAQLQVVSMVQTVLVWTLLGIGLWFFTTKSQITLLYSHNGTTKTSQ